MCITQPELLAFENEEHYETDEELSDALDNGVQKKPKRVKLPSLTRSFYFRNTARHKDVFAKLMELAGIAKRLYNQMLYQWSNWRDAYDEFLSKYDLAYLLRHYHHQQFVDDFGDSRFDASIAVFYGGIEGWFQTLKAFNKDPKKFKAKPQPPKFLPKDWVVYHFAERRCRRVGHGFKLAKTDLIIPIPEGVYTSEMDTIDLFKQIRFLPVEKDCFKIEIVYTKAKQPKAPIGYSIGIDPNLNNLAIVSDNPAFVPLLLNLKPLKALNQYYNKQKAVLYAKSQGTNRSHRIDRMGSYRYNYIKAVFHQYSHAILKICEKYNISHVYIGHNNWWKQQVPFGVEENQKFVSIPFNLFIDILNYKLAWHGRGLIEVDESFTTKTDHLAGALIPTPESLHKIAADAIEPLSPHIKDRLFHSATSKTIHADINGAMGILRRGTKDRVLNALQAHPKIQQIRKLTFRAGVSLTPYL
jgi:putative transposase